MDDAQGPDGRGAGLGADVTRHGFRHAGNELLQQRLAWLILLLPQELVELLDVAPSARSSFFTTRGTISMRAPPPRAPWRGFRVVVHVVMQGDPNRLDL